MSNGALSLQSDPNVITSHRLCPYPHLHCYRPHRQHSLCLNSGPVERIHGPCVLWKLAPSTVDSDARRKLMQARSSTRVVFAERFSFRPAVKRGFRRWSLWTSVDLWSYRRKTLFNRGSRFKFVPAINVQISVQTVFFARRSGNCRVK